MYSALHCTGTDECARTIDASRVAAELLGSHAALANAVANALEGLKRGR